MQKYYIKRNLQNISFLIDAIYANLDKFTRYLLPIYKKTIPSSTSSRSTILLLRFFSCSNVAPNRNDTITLPLRTMETMLIIASGKLKA